IFLEQLFENGMKCSFLFIPENNLRSEQDCCCTAPDQGAGEPV
uniref:Uncharacterized protein n=1 Tax=Aegilops tauschii subsp. strangulata TaxID=200361 RepID=A0A453KBZ5_AEGTS